MTKRQEKKQQHLEIDRRETYLDRVEWERERFRRSQRDIDRASWERYTGTMFFLNVSSGPHEKQ